jgi:hypothetical protein
MDLPEGLLASRCLERPGYEDLYVFSGHFLTRGTRGDPVAVILELHQERRRITARRGFAGWARRFSDSFNEHTSLADLSDTVLRTLSQTGEGSSLLIQDLVIRLMGLGSGARFQDLERQARMMVMDISLFLLDQFRFEVMRRLGWVENSPVFRLPILDLVERFPAVYSSMKDHTPALLHYHPRYHEYLRAFEGDRSVIVRRLIPDALEVFQEEDKGA